MRYSAVCDVTSTGSVTSLCNNTKRASFSRTKDTRGNISGENNKLMGVKSLKLALLTEQERRPPHIRNGH